MLRLIELRLKDCDKIIFFTNKKYEFNSTFEK